MSQYIFIEDFIILKSEIVSVQFHFEKLTGSRLNRIEGLKSNPKVWGETTVLFILRDGSTRMITERCFSERLDELKENVTNQMKAEVQPRTSKTSTTTIRKVPVNPW